MPQIELDVKLAGNFAGMISQAGRSASSKNNLLPH
jgi:hypothetical protein